MRTGIVLFPEELENIETRLRGIEKALEKEQQQLEDPILDTEGVMKLLNVSRRSLQNWRDQCIIEFSAIGGKLYYRMSAINKMLTKYLKTDFVPAK